MDDLSGVFSGARCWSVAGLRPRVGVVGWARLDSLTNKTSATSSGQPDKETSTDKASGRINHARSIHRRAGSDL